MSNVNFGEDAPILIVENSPEDYKTTEKAFREAGMNNPIVHCADNDDALNYLSRKGKWEDPETSPRPAVVLFDLNQLRRIRPDTGP